MRFTEKEKVSSIITFLTNNGVSKDKAKSYLVDAEKIASEELNKKKSDFGGSEWKYVMGIVKKMANIKESNKNKVRENDVMDKKTFQEFMDSDVPFDEFMSDREVSEELVSSDIAKGLGRASVGNRDRMKKKVRKVQDPIQDFLKGEQTAEELLSAMELPRAEIPETDRPYRNQNPNKYESKSVREAYISTGFREFKEFLKRNLDVFNRAWLNTQNAEYEGKLILDSSGLNITQQVGLNLFSVEWTDIQKVEPDDSYTNEIYSVGEVSKAGDSLLFYILLHTGEEMNLELSLY